MNELQYHRLFEQLETLSWKVDQLFIEVDSQVTRIQAQLNTTLEIHQRLEALEAIAELKEVGVA